MRTRQAIAGVRAVATGSSVSRTRIILLTSALVVGLTAIMLGGCSSGDLGTTSTVVSPTATVTAPETTSTTGLDNPSAEAALFPIRVDGKWGYIDRQGRVVVEPQFDEAYPFSEGLGRIGVDQKTAGKFGFVDATGAIVIEPQFGWANSFSEGVALARLEPGGKNGYIDKTGHWVIQ